jgi:hypothetical protein
MNKDKLNRFIQKYNLGGNVNSVKWKTDSNKLTTTFITPDKSLLGEVSVDDFTFEDSELGVYQTDQLQKLIGVLSDNINLSVSRSNGRPTSLNIQNGTASIDYVLSDLSVIADPPNLKKVPEFDTRIKLDTRVIDTFIRGKGALSDVDSFTILNENGKLVIVIGYSNINTNRVNIPVECEVNNLEDPITFNANLFREILVANRECTSAVLEVSSQGLARVNFKVDEYDSTYHIVSLQGDV